MADSRVCKVARTDGTKHRPIDPDRRVQRFRVHGRPVVIAWMICATAGAPLTEPSLSW